MSGELKSCPWCGRVARIKSNNDWYTLIVRHKNSCILRDAQAIFVPRTDEQKALLIKDWNNRHGAGDAEDAARLRHLLDRHLSLTPVEGGGWDIAEYSEHGIETVLFGHADARAAIDRVMQYHGQTDEAARAGERG